MQESRHFFVTNGNGEKVNDVQSILKNVPFSDKELLDRNKEIFGHNAFRAGQLEVIKSVLCGMSVFCIMPTGGGKSLCYQLPAVMLPGVSIVISPLLSLVQDQVEALREAGVVVGSMTGNSSDNVMAEVWQSIRSHCAPAIKIIYTTPEKLNQSPSIQRMLQAMASCGILSMFVIDEVHCMSQWGHDFRVDYKRLGDIRNTLFPNVPLMALTATATDTVKQVSEWMIG